MSAVEARSQHTSAAAVAIAGEIMQRLELAWNRADGTAFGEPFSAEADFVAIRGELHTGREAIAAGHQQIFDTIYAGSTARYEVLQARELDERVIVAHIRGTIDAPGGPLAGEHACTITVVLLRHGDEYEITSFHNTLITG
jgi:uncharacterized protein (TIGR02246 family)